MNKRTTSLPLTFGSHNFNNFHRNDESFQIKYLIISNIIKHIWFSGSQTKQKTFVKLGKKPGQSESQSPLLTGQWPKTNPVFICN